MYHQNTQKLFILSIFSNSFTSSQTSLTRLSLQLLSHYFPEGNSQLPFQNTAPADARKGVHVAVPLPILSASSPFAFAAHLHRWQCSSKLAALPPQPLSCVPFGDCGPLSTFAMTLLCSQDVALLFVYGMSWDTTSAHALPYKAQGINTMTTFYSCLLRLLLEDTALSRTLIIGGVDCWSFMQRYSSLVGSLMNKVTEGEWHSLTPAGD